MHSPAPMQNGAGAQYGMPPMMNNPNFVPQQQMPPAGMRPMSMHDEMMGNNGGAFMNNGPIMPPNNQNPPFNQQIPNGLMNNSNPHGNMMSPHQMPMPMPSPQTTPGPAPPPNIMSPHIYNQQQHQGMMSPQQQQQQQQPQV